jgi:hypothetical protein
MAHEAGFLAEEVEMYDKYELISEKGTDDYGWWTTNPVKSQQAYAAWEAIVMDQVQFMDDWVCQNPFEPNVEKRRTFTKNKFIEQLKKYSEYEMATSDALSIPRTGVSGVVNKEGKRTDASNDDLCVAFCMAIWLWKKIKAREIPGFRYQEVFGWQLKRDYFRTGGSKHSERTDPTKRRRMGF